MTKAHIWRDGCFGDSSIVEDYLKSVHELSQQAAGRMASTGEVAQRLGVSPGTVTYMFKKLANSGLLRHKLYCGARLTTSGQRLVQRVLHRHQVVGAFLGQVLGLNERDAHEEAERLEHVVSDIVIARMEELLNHCNCG